MFGGCHVSRGREGDAASAGEAGPRRRVSGRADLLRPDACQHRIPEAGAAAGRAVRGRLCSVRRDRCAVGFVCRLGSPSACDDREAVRIGRAGRSGRGGGGQDVRAVGVPRRCAGRQRCRRLFPASGDLSPDLPFAANAAGWRQADQAAAGRRCPRACRAPGS